MVKSFLLRTTFAALLCLGVVPVAGAWGALGHSAIGELAERHLHPAARAEVAALLAGEKDPTLAGIANWADTLRNEDPERFKATSRWHYINAKGGGCHFDIERDCADGGCGWRKHGRLKTYGDCEPDRRGCGALL